MIKQLEYNENGYRDVLSEVFLSNNNLIVLDCEKTILAEVLKQCQQVGLISQGYYFFLTSLDAHTVNLEDFKYGGTNITAFRMINVDKIEVQRVVYDIVAELGKQTNWGGGTFNVGDGGNMALDTATALIYDSVNAFALALHELKKVQQINVKQLDCAGEEFWAHGNSLINYMKVP